MTLKLKKQGEAPMGHLEPVPFDPHQVSVQYVDWIVAAGFGPAPGTINIDLAAIDSACSDKKQPRAVVQCKLRMTGATAQNVIRSLSVAIAAMQQPVPDAGNVN